MRHEDPTQQKRSWRILLVVLLIVTSCEQQEKQEKQIQQSDKDRIEALGFDIRQLKDLGDYYLVENDIMLRKDLLFEYKTVTTVDQHDPASGRTQQARVADLVSQANQRNITVFVDGTIPVGGDDDWRTEVQQAIDEINAIPYSRIRMQYVTSGPADITIRDDQSAPPPFLDDGQWVWNGAQFVWVWTLAAAEWPAGGNSGFQIRINLDTDNNRVFTTGQKKYNMAHELGHCVGFRHTNWSGLSETAGIGITGTPNTGSNPDPNSVMNGGTALNSWTSFSAYDKIAYSSTYPAMTISVGGPVKGWNSGTYTWTASSANGIGPVTYVWNYGYDGINYNGDFGTGTSRTAQLPLDLDLYLRVTATAADGETATGDHMTMNLGDR
jgi:hypothetical protein